MNISKIMASPFGSFLKAFAVAFLSLLAARYKDETLVWNIQALFDIVLASLFAVVPVIINYINPEYKNYGEGS